MSDWEKFVEPAASALHSEVSRWPEDAGLPYFPGLRIEGTFKRLAQVVLRAVGPLIVADTQQRMVEAAARAVEREQTTECETPDPQQGKACADPDKYRWYCLRGRGGAPADVCPLPICERRGANNG